MSKGEQQHRPDFQRGKAKAAAKPGRALASKISGEAIKALPDVLQRLFKQVKMKTQMGIRSVISIPCILVSNVV